MEICNWELAIGNRQQVIGNWEKIIENWYFDRMDFLDSLEVFDSANCLVWFGLVWFSLVWFGTVCKVILDLDKSRWTCRNCMVLLGFKHQNGAAN